MEIMSKLILVSLSLIWCIGGIVEGFTYDEKEVETEEGKSAMFERWRSHHNMQAMHDKDKKKQYEAFKANLEIVHSTNKAKKPYKLQMNKFAGMGKAEFQSKYTGLKASPKIRPGMKSIVSEAEWPHPFKYRNFTDVPPAIDWRAQGVVTPVVNQGGCGSCYAFAAADTIASLHAIRTKQLIELSPKEILDCCNCGGCNGGKMHDAFLYVANNKGLTTAKNYPYKPVAETCNVKKEHDVAVEIHGYERVPFNSEPALMASVANQPVQASIECEEPFMLYKEGVMTAPTGTNTGHAVVIVGYDTDPDGTKYWIAKNSWGTDWGEEGYVRLLRGVPEKEGYSGVNTKPRFPTREEAGQDDTGRGDPVVHMSRDL
ncbi:unnamed protein product [Lactuca saligna]|uniref:Uncharacterized protein n=1 Tax=Lactuca saligna TaxID=75948 RepID=A0AA35UQH3_LACSI|nr:unnamed protein product [Lactuca saligna]